MTQTLTQTKPQFLTEALIEVLNNQWKVNAIESHNMIWHRLEVEEGRKYLKVWERLIRNGDVDSGHDDQENQDIQDARRSERSHT